MVPLFLDIGRVMRIHQSLIEVYGGVDGLRDVGLLHSALSMSQASFGGQYLHTDLFEMAAAYLYHIVQNHPFLDGNKRTGAATAIRLNVRKYVDIDIRPTAFRIGKSFGCPGAVESRAVESRK